MKSYKVITASFLAASIVMPSMALAAPFDLKIVHRDGSDSSDVNQSLMPPTLLNGTNYFPYFDDVGETYQFGAIGSGFNFQSGTWSVTPFSIETTDGHLSDTLSAIENNISSLTGTVSGLGMVFNISTFMGNNASTSPYIASSTQNGFMGSSDKAKLASLSVPVAYEGTTARSNPFPVFKSATVGSGVATVNLTNDGTSGGTALCTGGVIPDSVSVIFNDNASSYQQSWAFTNSNKTLTVTANKFTSANILSGLLGQTAANGSVAKISVWCYA